MIDGIAYDESRPLPCLREGVKRDPFDAEMAWRSREGYGTSLKKEDRESDDEDVGERFFEGDEPLEDRVSTIRSGIDLHSTMVPRFG